MQAARFFQLISVSWYHLTKALLRTGNRVPPGPSNSVLHTKDIYNIFMHPAVP